jgi:hypothetical protein
MNGHRLARQVRVIDAPLTVLSISSIDRFTPSSGRNRLPPPRTSGSIIKRNPSTRSSLSSIWAS